MATVEAHTELMRAAVLSEYGSEENLHLESISRPAITADQVLIKVHAAGINPVDWKLRQGKLKWVMPDKLPAVLGYDVAGELAEVGYSARQKGWHPGESVVAYSDNLLGGGYAEYVAVNADFVVRKPERLSYEEAAALPLAGTTAWKSLVKLGRLHSGDEVLVNGASGGVGILAVQIAKALGARVTGVCSIDNHHLVREIGADDLIDYHTTDFTRIARSFDIVFDAVSKSTFRDCRRVLKPQGHYVATLPSVERIGYSVVSQFQRQGCHVVLARPDGDTLRSLAALVEEGKLRPIIDSVFPLTEVAAAHRKSEGGHVVGKVILKVLEDMSASGEFPEGYPD